MASNRVRNVLCGTVGVEMFGLSVSRAQGLDSMIKGIFDELRKFSYEIFARGVFRERRKCRLVDKGRI